MKSIYKYTFIKRYEITNISIFIILWLCFALVLLHSSCKKKETSHSKPQIILNKDSNLIYLDTLLPLGSVMQFSISASSSDVPITNFKVFITDSVTQVFMDTGIYNTSLNYKIRVLKSGKPTEKWTFFVMNKNRDTSSISINIGLQEGGNFENIQVHDFILAAQNNENSGHFYSFSTSQFYSLEQAYYNQGVQDMVFYYHNDFYAVLSSPNDNDAPSVYTGTYGISKWQTRNESRYNATNLSVADFDNIHNDSLILISYDMVNAKRKAKNVMPDQIWAFRIVSGKLGLVKINTLNPGMDGTIALTVKIQK